MKSTLGHYPTMEHGAKKKDKEGYTTLVVCHIFAIDVL